MREDEQDGDDDNGGLRNASRSALIEKRGEIRDEFKTKLEEAKQEWKDKRAALIENLKKIKDEKKVEIVENVDARLADRNAHWVEHWTNVLTRHSELLDKIQTKATELEGQGKDITSVTSAIAAARSAITTAQAKVTEQAGKTYTIPVTTEATLGANVSATVKQMQADVKSVINLIEAVRKATQAAISALKTVAGVASSPVPSPTVQP
jgi:DNA repair exonuclease SbcCD ATPase subunit